MPVLQRAIRLSRRVCREHTILRCHDRMARGPALGAAKGREVPDWESQLTCAYPIRWSPGIACCPSPEVDVSQGIGHRRRSRSLSTLFRFPMDLGYLETVGKRL